VAFTLLVLVALSGWLVLGWQHLPGPFTASALVYIAKTPPRVMSTSPNEAASSQEDFDEYRRTQEAMVKSRLVLNAALRQPKIADLSIVRDQADPVEWLEKEVKTDFNAAPEILTVSLKGNKPEELTKVVDAVVDAYLQEFVHREDRARADRISRLTGLYGKFDEQVREKRKNLTDLARILGAKDQEAIAIKRQLVRQDLADTHREVRRVHFELIAAQTRLARLQAQTKAGEPAAAVAKLEEEVAVLAEQKKMLEREQEVLAQEAARPLPDENQVDAGNLTTEIAQAEEMLKKVGAQQDALGAELVAPPRVSRMEQAVIRTR
jgi:capsule polysaccharide export protein KpsE/RkpR